MHFSHHTSTHARACVVPTTNLPFAIRPHARWISYLHPRSRSAISIRAARVAHRSPNHAHATIPSHVFSRIYLSATYLPSVHDVVDARRRIVGRRCPSHAHRDGARVLRGGCARRDARAARRRRDGAARRDDDGGRGSDGGHHRRRDVRETRSRVGARSNERSGSRSPERPFAVGASVCVVWCAYGGCGGFLKKFDKGFYV